METLLKKEFTAHYRLPVSVIDNISKQTDAPYFELKDDVNLIYLTESAGVARYSNNIPLTVTVINYEVFIDSLPSSFRLNKEKCDLIVHTNNSKYFLLNELTDTKPEYVIPYRDKQGKRNKAISQLLSSLKDLTNVNVIQTFIKTFSERRCCFFNKQPNAPESITAVQAFGRVNNLSQQGFKMKNSDIESYGFNLYEYSGLQVLRLQ